MHSFGSRGGRLRATPAVHDQIRRAANAESLFIGAFSFYEIAHAVKRKRLVLSMPLLDWLQGITAGGLPSVLEITPQVAATTFLLPDDFHGDPGNRILAATAMTYGLTICTHDKQMLRHAKQGTFDALKVSEGREI